MNRECKTPSKNYVCQKILYNRLHPFPPKRANFVRITFLQTQKQIQKEVADEWNDFVTYETRSREITKF